MLSKLGLAEQQREDEKYEDLTKNMPSRTKWFGVHALVDEAAEEEAKKRQNKKWPELRRLTRQVLQPSSRNAKKKSNCKEL